LNVCKGDCDNDNDCNSGLRCAERNAGDPGPTQCLGSVITDGDYCVPAIPISISDSNKLTVDASYISDEMTFTESVKVQIEGNTHSTPADHSVEVSINCSITKPVISNMENNIGGANV
jgi:hypothetical protein